MQITLKKAIDDIKGGNISPCYLIYGEEEYLMKDALDQIIEHLLPRDDRDFNLFFIDGENEDIDAICESIITPPLLPGNKVVAIKNTRLFQSKTSAAALIKEVIENLEKDKQKAAKTFMAFLDVAGWSFEDLRDGGWEKIPDSDWGKMVKGEVEKKREDWLPEIIKICIELDIKQRFNRRDTDRLEEVLEGTIPAGNSLVLTADKVDRQKKIFKAISKKGAVITFPAAKPKSGAKKDLLMERTGKILAKSGKRLTPEAMQELGRRTGFDLRISQKEIEKLITYAGDKETIDKRDIDAIIKKSSEDSIFDLTAAIVDKDVEKALVTFKDLLNQGVHYMVILSMIIREIRFLLQGKILLKGGAIPSFHQRMHYRDFQNIVYPGVKELAKRMGKNSEWLAGQHPYVIYNNLKNSERYSYNGLLGYMEKLLDCDIELKTTGIEPKLVMERLLIDICS